MKPIYHNPENVTQKQLEPDQGWRFLLEGEQVVLGDQARDRVWFNVIYLAVHMDWTYRTKRPLPIKYCQGDNAEAFYDPAYRRSVEHYAAQGKEVEVWLICRVPTSMDWGWCLRPINKTRWHWELGVRYRLSAEPPPPCLEITWESYDSRTVINPEFSGYKAAEVSTGDPERGFCLYSRGRGGCWEQRTKPEWSPQPGMVPVRLDGKWVWENQKRKCEHQHVTVTEDGGRCDECNADLAYSRGTRNWEQPTRKIILTKEGLAQLVMGRDIILPGVVVTVSRDQSTPLETAISHFTGKPFVEAE